ncbi:ATP-binding region, ATPase-like domain protein [Candidatus Magnetobacterium bavaricum]|uniref:histidine kinase n=1 Tax=Candidatus Magnetobacterium bavaricum TaxID=29290 RepID=A0A0F3GJH1_9BACT|nr:ATP-binding region, ATPase-like domain protein [Candidatus Magnetobacterium bavaricum]
MEVGKMTWKKDTINMQHLLHHAVKATSSLFLKNDAVRPVVEVEKNIPDTVGDYDRILQVLINMISNGFKFSTEGNITLKACCSSDGQLTISVTDEGMGIPAEQQEMVFEKFKQIGDTLTDKPKGTGLGLPICKEIVEHHGGRIWVESGYGQGSTFSFTLPVIQPDVINGDKLELAAETQASTQDNGKEESRLCLLLKPPLQGEGLDTPTTKKST